MNSFWKIWYISYNSTATFKLSLLPKYIQFHHWARFKTKSESRNHVSHIRTGWLCIPHSSLLSQPVYSAIDRSYKSIRKRNSSNITSTSSGCHGASNNRQPDRSLNSLFGLQMKGSVMWETFLCQVVVITYFLTLLPWLSPLCLAKCT